MIKLYITALQPKQLEGTGFDKTPLPLLDTASDNAPVGVVVFVVVGDYN